MLLLRFVSFLSLWPGTFYEYTCEFLSARHWKPVKIKTDWMKNLHIIAHHNKNQQEEYFVVYLSEHSRALDYIGTYGVNISLLKFNNDMESWHRGTCYKLLYLFIYLYIEMIL